MEVNGKTFLHSADGCEPVNLTLSAKGVSLGTDDMMKSIDKWSGNAKTHYAIRDGFLELPNESVIIKL